MKKFYLITILIFCAGNIVAQGQDDDDSKKVRKYRPGTNHYFKIDLGLNNYLEDGDFPDSNNQPYAVKPFGSWYVALQAVNSTKIAGPLNLEWGANFSWYNFKFENADYRIDKGTDQVVFFEETATTSALKSKLTVSYINLSMVPVLDFGYRDRHHYRRGDFIIDWHKKHGFRIGAGGYAGYRLGSHSKFVTKDGDRDRTKERSNFFLENFRYGVRGQIGIGSVDLFFNYDLNELFSDNRGPALNPISFGIILL